MVSESLKDYYLAQRLKKENMNTGPKLSDLPFFNYLREDFEEFIQYPLSKQNCKERSIFIEGDRNTAPILVAACAAEYDAKIVSEFLGERKDVRKLFRNAELVEPSIIFIENLDRIKEEGIIFELIESYRSLIKSNKKVVVVGTAEKSIDDLLTSIFPNRVVLRHPSHTERRSIIEYLAKKYSSDLNNIELIAESTPGKNFSDIERLFTRAVYRKERKNIQFEEALLSLLEKKSEKFTFDSIGALTEIKEVLNLSVLLPSKYPSLFKSIGLSKPSGLLLYGPPGCGKTLIAKALSSTLHCNFISVRGPELINKYLGDSEKHLRELFEKAKQMQPSIIFFDEIDSIAKDRSGDGAANGRIVNQLLTLLDGAEDRGEIYVVGATNRIELIDRALLRPGRFDRVLEIKLPGIEERFDIFNKLIGNVRVNSINFNGLNTDGFSGAEISGLIKEAGMVCIEELSRNNIPLNESTVILEQRHFLKAVERIEERRLN